MGVGGLFLKLRDVTCKTVCKVELRDPKPKLGGRGRVGSRPRAHRKDPQARPGAHRIDSRRDNDSRTCYLFGFGRRKIIRANVKKLIDDCVTLWLRRQISN